jgi:amino acid transporter
MLVTRFKRLLLGNPLPSHSLSHQRLPKWKALSVLSSDALSSVAYATEEMLIPLATFSLLAANWSLPIAIAIAGLLVIVTLSYRQTIEAYPQGGGAYTVAKENLGTYPSLVAGAALLIDYILTVAVSVAAGVAAVTSAVPSLRDHKVGLGVAVILVVMTMNLRGIKESASVFALPTYLFIGSSFYLIFAGLYQVASGSIPNTPDLLHEVYPEIPIFLLLRAFSSGCAALTGIEAISDGVPLFRDPVSKNAKITLMSMGAILASLFLGITVLAHYYQILPAHGETTLSLIARQIYGETWIYYLTQASTAMILLLAANTSYADFPRLASFLAKDRFLPRQFAGLGDKLVFSNGIVGLSLAAIGLIVLFKGETHALVPLYAVGVFLSFTISQSGMVMHHLKEKPKGFRRMIFFNALGAVTTFAVLTVIAITKFMDGAWVVILLIPTLIFIFSRINKHYMAVGRELSLIGMAPPQRLERLKHTVIIPISGIHRGVIDALRYAISISDDVRACYVELDEAQTEVMKREWTKWAHEIPFVVLKSPYRSVISPLIDYINDVEKICNEEMITVIIPEFVTTRWWHRILHNQTALLIRAALMFRKGKVVTSVRYHLRDA